MAGNEKLDGVHKSWHIGHDGVSQKHGVCGTTGSQRWEKLEDNRRLDMVDHVQPEDNDDTVRENRSKKKKNKKKSKGPNGFAKLMRSPTKCLRWQ